MKRFGRNQRRALREALAASEAVRLTGCAPAPVGTPKVEDWGIVEWNLHISDRGPYDRLEREVSVVAYNMSYDAWREQRRVSFQGGLHVITDVHQHGGYLSEAVGRTGPLEVTLLGVFR